MINFFVIDNQIFVFINLGVVSTVVPDSPHKVFIGGLPNYLNEDQVCLNLINISLYLGRGGGHRVHFMSKKDILQSKSAKICQ